MFSAKLPQWKTIPKLWKSPSSGGKVLVTFADGMMALLESRMIRRLAVEADALKPLPKEPIDSD
jgi:hypothetical protein